MTKDEKYNIKLEKVDEKTTYENLLIKYAELENKIADIKANCDLAIEGRDIKIKELEKACEETQELLDKQIEATYKLDKENAELKHNKKTVVHLADCLEEKMKERIEELETRCTELFLQNNEFAERFEKSIAIIKELLSCCRNYPQENAEKVEQARQFIKEIEK